MLADVAHALPTLPNEEFQMQLLPASVSLDGREHWEQCLCEISSIYKDTN